jgi:uncharacterized membrane protein YbhN (UPF0104 family)
VIQPASADRKIMPRLLRLLQVAVTLGLSAWVLNLVDAQTWALLRQVGAGPVLIAVFGVLIAHVLAGVRLFVLLRLLKQPISLPAVLLRTFIGVFASTFLPSTISGDVVKGLLLARDGAESSALVGALLLDRMLNVLTMAALALAALALLAGAAGTAAAVAIVAILAGTLGLAAVIAVLAAVQTRWEWAGRLRANLWLVLQTPHTLGLAVGLSAVSIFASVWGLGAVAWMLGIQAGILALTGAVCFATLVAMIPITINGFGLQEASLLVALTAAGASGEQALAFALLTRGSGWYQVWREPSACWSGRRERPSETAA